MADEGSTDPSRVRPRVRLLESTRIRLRKGRPQYLKRLRLDSEASERLHPTLLDGQLPIAHEELLERDRCRHSAGEEARGSIANVLPRVRCPTRDEHERSRRRLIRNPVASMNPRSKTATTPCPDQDAGTRPLTWNQVVLQGGPIDALDRWARTRGRSRRSMRSALPVPTSRSARAVRARPRPARDGRSPAGDGIARSLFRRNRSTLFQSPFTPPSVMPLMKCLCTARKASVMGPMARTAIAIWADSAGIWTPKA